MVVPNLIQWKHLLLMTLLLVATTVSSQNFSTRHDYKTEIQEQEHEDASPGIVDKFYNFFSKMKGFVTGQNPEAARRLEKFRKQIIKESRSLNQELHTLEGKVRYSKVGTSRPNYRFAHDHPITQSRKKRDHAMDFILHQDSEDNMVLSNVLDMEFLLESAGSRRSMDVLVHNDMMFLVVVDSQHHAEIYSFDKNLENNHIGVLENVTECKFGLMEDISLLLLICIPPLDAEDTSFVTVSKMIKFAADGKYYLFRHQKLRIENPSTTHMWYQNQDNYLLIGQRERFNSNQKSVYQTESVMYIWTGSYFNKIEEGGILPGNNVTSVIHFQAGYNHYLAMANYENNKGDHNIFSNIFKYSLSKERYEMWHRIPTKGATHFASFTLGTGLYTENFLVVANYCEDDNDKCDPHTNSVIYKIESEKFSQFQCIETHGAVKWMAIEVSTGILLAVANSLTGAAFYQYNGWKFVQVDVNTERIPALGPGISSINAFTLNGSYYMSVTNSNNENLSLLFYLEFEADTHLKSFHSVASKWCSGGNDYIKNGPQPKDLIDTVNKVHWINSTCTFTNTVTFKKSLILKTNATSHLIYVEEDGIRIPESTVPIFEKQNIMNNSLNMMIEKINDFVPLNHSWPDGLQLTRLEVESGSVNKVLSKTIDGVSVDPDDLILIKSTSTTVEKLHLLQAHLQSDVTLRYLNNVLWSDLVTLNGNHWLIDGKTFSGNLSAVHLEVEGKFQDLSFGHSQILDASTANYTGGIVCDSIDSPAGVFAPSVASHDLEQLQLNVVTNDAPVHIGSLHVNNSVAAIGIITEKLAGQNLEEIFKQSFMTDLIEKQVILDDHSLNSASMLNIHVYGSVNDVGIPKDVLINSPIREYKFDSATFPNLKAASLAINHKLNDIKVINGSLDVLSTKEREVQVVTASKNFEHLNLTVGMMLRNQTFEDVDFISETPDLRKRRFARDDLRNWRSASMSNNLCPDEFPQKFFMLTTNDKLWQQLLVTVRTAVNSQLLQQQLTYLSKTVCLTPEEDIVIYSLQHNVHCALSDMTIMDNILSLFKNKCSAGQQKEIFNRERLQKVKGAVDSYRQRVEKNIMKLLINPLDLSIKQKIGSNLGNQLFLVDLLLQLFYNNKNLNKKEIHNEKIHKGDYGSQKSMLDNHVLYFLKNIDILYNFQLVSFHSVYKLKNYTASGIARENIDTIINFEMERIIKTMSIIESKNRNLCFFMRDVEKDLNSMEQKNIVFMLQMHKNKILSLLLENMNRQKDLPEQINSDSHSEFENTGYMDLRNVEAINQHEASENGQTDGSEKVDFIPLSRQARSIFNNSNTTSTSGLEDADVEYITDQQGNKDVLYISKNPTIITEMLSNSRMVEKFIKRFDKFFLLAKNVNSTEKLEHFKQTNLVTSLERLINVLNKTLTNANDYILRWEDTEVQHVDEVVNDAIRATDAFQFQLPDNVWKKIDYIKYIVPIVKNKTDEIQKILLEKLQNTEHFNNTDNCNSEESCISINPNNINETIKEDFITFYILNNNFNSEEIKENSDSCTSKPESLLDYLKVAQDYISCVWEFAWFPVYVDDGKEDSVVANKINVIASETEHLLDTMSNNKDYGYKMLDTECLSREINSLELAVEILKIVKVPNKVKRSLIHLKYHGNIVDLTSSISEKLHNSKTFRKKLIDRGIDSEDDSFMGLSKENDGTEDREHKGKNSKKSHTSIKDGKLDEKNPNNSHKQKHKRIKRSAESMIDSLDDFSKKTIEFINQFDHHSPLYILNKTNGEELMYYYSQNTILNEKYSHVISEELKYRMEEIAERIPDILLKFEILKNADHSLVELLSKSKVFERIGVPYLFSDHLPQGAQRSMNNTDSGFDRLGNVNNTNNFGANIPLSRFKRQDIPTEISEKLNSDTTLIDSVLLRYIENGTFDRNETRKKIQCFMENDDFYNVLLSIQMLEEHLDSLLIQNTSQPNSARDSEHELHEKIQQYMNYHAIKVIKTFNNVKSNFGKSLANINTKILRDEAENYNCISEILSAAGYIPCNINSKIKCINDAKAEIQKIMNVSREFITQQVLLSSSPYVESICKQKNTTNPMQGKIYRLNNPELGDHEELLASEILSNQSHVTLAIYYIEETISFLHMFEKINPLPVLLIASEVQPPKGIMGHLKDVDTFLDGIIEGTTHFLNTSHLINSFNETQLPLIFLKLKNAMAILEERESFHTVGLRILDTIFGTIGDPGKIEKAILEMEKKKNHYEEVLQKIKSNFANFELDDLGKEVAVAPEKLVIPMDHDRFSTVSGSVAGYNLQDIISRLYINESAHKFLDEFDISNVHNITISGSLTVQSHINGISPSILHRACPLTKPFNNITFVFRKPVIIKNNLLAYYVSSIPFENYATTVGKHVFYKEVSFVGGVKFYDDVLVRSKVNDHEIYHLTKNIALKDETNKFIGNLTFNKIKAENIFVERAIVQNIDLNDIVTLKGASIITGNKTFSNIVSNENLSVETMKADYIDTKYNSNVKVDKIFQNNFRKNSSEVQILSGVQVFRNLTFNVDADVSVGIFDYSLNSLSKRVVYKDESVMLSNDLKSFNNTKIDNLTFSSFDNVTSLKSWLMKDGDQNINSFSSFNKLKASVVKIKNDIVMNDTYKLNFDYFVSNAIKIDEPTNLQYNILWNSIKFEGANISVDGLVQGIDISEETVPKESVDVALGGKKYFEKAVNFNGQNFDIEGHFNGRNLTLFCSDKYFHNLTVHGSWIMEKIVKAKNVTCHSRELPEKNWESCWQADKNHTLMNKLNIAKLEMKDGSFSSLSDNISLSTFQNEILWEKSDEPQSMKCATNLSTVYVESLKINSLITYKLGNYFANDLYDMLTRSDDQNITGLYDIYSVLVVGKLFGPDKLNYETLDHFCLHSKFCKIFAEKSIQGLYVEEFLKPHTDCVIQGIDISEWWEEAIKIDSSPKDLPKTTFVNLKIINGLVTTGLVDGVEIQNLLQKSANQTIDAKLVLNNPDNVVLMMHKLNISDGEINDYKLAQLLNRLVYIDKPAVIQGSTRFYNETQFKYANYSEQLTSLKKAVDWIIDESSVIHLRNEVVTLSHLALFANEALPRQPVKFEGWTVVQELTGMYHRIKALDFGVENSSPVYLALLSWTGPITLLMINNETNTYDTSGFQIAGNCTTTVSSLRNKGIDYIISSNGCGLDNFIDDLPKTVNYAFPFDIVSVNISQGFSLIWQMDQIEGPDLKWLINTMGPCDHQIIELPDNDHSDLCILLICHQGFDIRLMCIEVEDRLGPRQVFKQTYPVLKVSAISYTNELGEHNTFMVMVDSQGLNLWLYMEVSKEFVKLETKHLQQLIWVDLAYHNGDLFISAISSGFRGLEKGMIYVYKLDFNHLEMQYNHTSVLLKFISTSTNVTTPKLELYSSIPEDMPIECHFTKLQTGELSLFVTSGTGVVTRLDHRGVEGFRRSGDVLVPGSTTLEVWNSYRKGHVFTRLAPSGFSKMKPQNTVIMESSYSENEALNTAYNPKCDISDLPFLTIT